MFTIHDLEKQRNESKAWIVVGKMKKKFSINLNEDFMNVKKNLI